MLLSYLAVGDPDLIHMVACPGSGLLSEEVVRLGYEHVLWEATRSPGRGVAAEVRGVRDIVGSLGPDVVHLHSSKAGLAGRLAMRGSRPTVFQPHAWSFSAVSGLTRAMSIRWERSAQKWTHATVCVGTDELSRGRAAGVLRDNLHRSHLLTNAIDPSRWPVTDRSAARARLGLPVDVPLAVCVGRLCRQKGQDLLLSAWPQVTSGVQAAAQMRGAAAPQLVLVGDGPDRAALERTRPPGVRLVGADDPHPWYAAADVVVVPSRWEALAMVPLEAQALGRLVVATDVDGMREVLHPGQLIVPAERPVALAAALTQALSDRPAAAAIGGLARQMAEQQWALGCHQRRLRDIYAAADAAARISR